MRKKRVLAFLLAFSMAVGTNTTTVLAAENGADTRNAAAEVIADTAEAEEETMPEQMSEAEEETETKEDGEASEEEGASGEKEASEEAVPEENGGSDEKPSEDTDENTADVSDDAASGETEEQESTETDGAVSENTASLPEEEEPAAESKAVHEVRLMSFTDETGMCVTYDANAAATYQYTVSENGILTQITDENGEPLSGVVELAEGKGIREIGSAFTGNEGITYVKLPSGVTTIGDEAFKGCTSLKGIYLPNSVQTIGASAFENCTRLTQLAVPKNVQTIGDKAFSADKALFMIYMRDADYSSLTSIGEKAFYQCSALGKFCSDDSFVMPGALETIGASAFEECASIESVNLNESVSTMGAAAFKNCGKISSVVLSSRLSAIPDEAFKGCNNLISVTFKTGNASAGISGNTSIGVSAFEGCTGLGAIELVYSVAQVGNYAFKDCSKLIRAEIANGSAVLGDAIFNGCSADLTLVGLQGSQVEAYAEQNSLRFVGYQEEAADAAKQYYKYDIFLPGEKPCGKLTVVDKDGKDPNTLNANKGVVAGTTLYVNFQPDNGYVMVSGSLKCNGKLITQNKDGVYSFAMPKGGALLTAEFEPKDSSQEKTLGIDADISVELSNGAVMNSKNEVDGALLKVGQTTRFFLIDSKDGNRAVKASKITFTSKKPEVASVDANGVIRALKEGKAEITAKVMGYDGVGITRSIVAEISTADIDELRLKAVDYDASVIEETQSGAYEAVKINQVKVKDKAQTFKIKATAYDTEGDDTAAKLKWSTSDSKIAALGSTSTGTDSTENTVTIPMGASGEATITVTAANTSKDAEKKTVTQKFVVRVIDDTPRLASSSLTLNPKLEDGAALEIIRSYDNDIDTDKVELRNTDKDKTKNTEFVLTYSEQESTDAVKTFRVTSRNAENGKTYSLLVRVNEKYEIPLKISVKESVPKAKLSLEKKQQKINLFYANDGTEIRPVISGLGNAKISEYALEPLDTTKDNKLFTENFRIDPQTGVITQKSSSMLYGTDKLKNKPVVTGYVVLTYEGYKEEVKTKLKITIPTQTVKPSYKLDKTSELFSDTCGEQTIELKLLDKKNKNAQVQLNNGEFTVTPQAASDVSVKCEITEEHTIRLTTPSRIKAGKVILRVENTKWADGKYFDYTYQIKTTGKAPKISLTSKTITLNPSYPEQIVNFGFQSDQKDTVYAEDQGDFHPKSGVRNTEEYEKLSVSYSGGEGQVQILDSTVKDGSYTFVLDQVQRLNSKGVSIDSGSVTLTVKVKKAVPTIKAKGTAAFNLQAEDEEGYVETSVLTLSSKEVPEEYELDAEQTKESVKCTTKSYDGQEQYFDWNFADQGVEKGSWSGQLSINLKQELPKKNYAFTFTPVYKNKATNNPVKGKTVKITVKIYSADISVNLSAKGKLNLLDREFTEYTTKNSVVYTPAFKNLKDQVDEVRIFDADGSALEYDDEESEFFKAEVLSDGKIYVSPKPDAEIDNNKTYSVKLWMKLKDYRFGSEDDGGTWSKVMKIKTAQTLPKIKTDKSAVSLYLSNKAYASSFVVEKSDEKAIGGIESISFGKEDTKAYDAKADESFELDYTCQADGSLKVSLKPKASVAYSCGSTNKVTMYVRFAGQGVNTDGVKITMNVKINK